MLAGVSLDAETPSSNRCSVKSSNHSGRSCGRIPSVGSVSSCLSSVSSESCKWSPNTRLRALPRRVDAGLGVESSTVKSCGTDVGHVLVVELEEPVVNPGQRSVHSFPCCILFFCRF